MEVKMAGTRMPGMGPGDDGYDEEGYDESQRAEILEVTRDGPSDGAILTDLTPDLGLDDPEAEPIDELEMEDGEVGTTDDDVDMDEEDMDEDDLQDDFDEGTVDNEEIDDADDVALKP
ncbi:DNA primase [uncultured Sphingomonas sp.]|uniref:DNA primase n=1 Tax=uncultured Sphingomonas sp. TaxID=158754 RepID=UPI0035C94797